MSAAAPPVGNAASVTSSMSCDATARRAEASIHSTSDRLVARLAAPHVSTVAVTRETARRFFSQRQRAPRSESFRRRGLPGLVELVQAIAKARSRACRAGSCRRWRLVVALDSGQTKQRKRAPLALDALDAVRSKLREQPASRFSVGDLLATEKSHRVSRRSRGRLVDACGFFVDVALASLTITRASTLPAVVTPPVSLTLVEREVGERLRLAAARADLRHDVVGDLA